MDHVPDRGRRRAEVWIICEQWFSGGGAFAAHYPIVAGSQGLSMKANSRQCVSCRSEERRVGEEWRSRCDWSSDVCSSDLEQWFSGGGAFAAHYPIVAGSQGLSMKANSRQCVSCNGLNSCRLTQYFVRNFCAAYRGVVLRRTFGVCAVNKDIDRRNFRQQAR